jgi:hypothetical protein
MKAILRKRFVLVNYYREFFQKIQSLAQESKSVEDYHKKMEIFIIRANVMEDKKVTMLRLLNGFNIKITNVVELQHYVELQDMVLWLPR